MISAYSQGTCDSYFHDGDKLELLVPATELILRHYLVPRVSVTRDNDHHYHHYHHHYYHHPHLSKLLVSAVLCTLGAMGGVRARVERPSQSKPCDKNITLTWWLVIICGIDLYRGNLKVNLSALYCFSRYGFFCSFYFPPARSAGGK